MSKVLFVMKYPLEEQYSIKNKLDGEMDAVSALGHDVYYISFDKKYLYLNHAGRSEKLQRTTFGNSSLYYHFISFHDIYRLAETVIKSEKIDLVYFRYGPLNMASNRLFRTASRISKMVVEIPTYPMDKEKQKSFVRRLYMKLSEYRWKSVAKYVSLFTLIGDRADSYLGVKALNIDNGVSIQMMPLKTGVKAADGKIHLLAVAAMCTWQGYDRVIKGLSQWEAPEAKNYVIDLVGDEGDGSLEEWKELAKKLGIEHQVVSHGRLTGEPLTEMFEMATIGLGTFGMYRKGMNGGSILKIREYMARGLPFLYAYDDPDLTEDMPWCVKFSNDSTPLDMKRVNAFIRSLGDYTELSKQMRKYAEQHMTWKAQFQKIFKEMEKCR